MGTYYAYEHTTRTQKKCQQTSNLAAAYSNAKKGTASVGEKSMLLQFKSSFSAYQALEPLNWAKSK